MFAYPDSAKGSIQTYFFSLTSFMGIPYSMRILRKTCLLNESEVFLKPTNRWCTTSLYSHSFSSIWRMQIRWSVVDLLWWNPHCSSPIISSAYGVNLDIKMVDNILYVTLCFSDRASWIYYILVTNLMHQLLFIHKIIFSSTCFEPQVLIFRRIQLYTCSIWYCHFLLAFLVACRYTAWVSSHLSCVPTGHQEFS